VIIHYDHAARSRRYPGVGCRGPQVGLASASIVTGIALIHGMWLIF